MSGYIMESEHEATRLVLKTERVLVRRHLAWARLRRGESFLDAGCGTAEVVREAARVNAVAQVVGLDGDAARLARAAAASRADGLDHVRFHRARLTGVGSSGLPDRAFDHAWARFLLEYLPAPADVVRELARVVRPGGRVTLIDIEGNGVWHYGISDRLRRGLDEVLADLAATGFDPHAGRKLATYARAAGLVDIRHEIEPYHRIVGVPDPRTARAWRLKIESIRDNYVHRLFPEKAGNAWVFDDFLAFVLSDHSMTWSLLHLVQGTRPQDA
jgi:ubiquinone/menaquinone biosynthesis C-methylase UbiE